MRLIDWASLILGGKFTVFLCFTLYLRAISKNKPPEGLIFGGAYFRNFTVTSKSFKLGPPDFYHRRKVYLNIDATMATEF